MYIIFSPHMPTLQTPLLHYIYFFDKCAKNLNNLVVINNSFEDDRRDLRNH